MVGDLVGGMGLVGELVGWLVGRLVGWMVQTKNQPAHRPSQVNWSVGWLGALAWEATLRTCCESCRIPGGGGEDIM